MTRTAFSRVLMRSSTAVLLGLGVLVGVASLSAQTSPKPAPLDRKSPGYLNSKSMPTPWPFTVSEVIFKCERFGGPTPEGIYLTLKAADGKEYAANETAAKAKKLPSIETLRLDNPKTPGTKVTTSHVLAFGYRLCD